jgi:hypothetical protein
MSERAFGIEIECGNERWDRWNGEAETAVLLRNNGFSRWANDVGSDGSGIEIRSPILQGQEGFKELKEVLAFLRSENFFTASIDGGHIHHDTPELSFDRPETWPAIGRLVESWYINEDHIHKLVHPRRRRLAHCHKITRPMVNSAKQGRIEGRGSLNWACIDDARPNVEIRLLEGSLDYELVSSWIKFGQRFIDNVLNRKSVLTCNDVHDLLKRTRMGARAQTKLLRPA